MNNSITRIKGDNSRKSGYGKETQVYATDVDYGLVVMSVADPAFSSVILDKYLLLCQHGNVTPLILLNKTDLSSETPSILDYYKNNLGIQVLLISTVTKVGIEELRTIIYGKTCVVLGRSGVGKSSLINALREDSAIKVGGVSDRFGEGRHTTTNTEKYLINGSTWIIDTPGLRNIDVSNVDPHLLKELYPDFVNLADNCKFSDCMHVAEPGCAVKEAVERGLIIKERYDNYLKIKHSV